MKLIDPINVVDSVLISTNIPENDALPYDPDETYLQGEEVIVIAANTHLVYRSLQNANHDHDPSDEPEDIEEAVWWIRVGATNRWRPFDEVLDTQATSPETMNYVLKPTGRIDSIVLLNVNAKNVHIKITDDNFGVVYEQTHSLVFKSGINTFFKWYFNPIVQINDFAITKLPNYANCTVEITLNRPGGIVGIGEIVLGKSSQVGLTKDGAGIAIIDFSTKTVNRFGDAKLKPGAFSKEQDLSMSVAKGEVSSTFAFMAKRRGQLKVFIATEEHGCTIAYGWYESCKFLVGYDDYSVLSAKIKGLR